MVKSRPLETELPPELVLQRAAELMASASGGQSPPRDLLAEPIYGVVHERSFTMRRAARPLSNLHGWLHVGVAPSAVGSTLAVVSRGADWLAVYSGACLAGAVFGAYRALSIEQAATAAAAWLVCAAGLAASAYCVSVIVNDWRVLRKHLLAAFPGAHAA
jgi:hypothetical protein